MPSCREANCFHHRTGNDIIVQYEYVYREQLTMSIRIRTRCE